MTDRSTQGKPMTNYTTILNRFIHSDEFAEAIINTMKSKEHSSGSYYMVELLPDETWNVLWFRVGDDTPMPTGWGKRLGIPELSPQEFQALKEEAGTDDAQKLAETLRKKDTIEKQAAVLRNLLREIP